VNSEVGLTEIQVDPWWIAHSDGDI
jgi:hypothetical protein